MLLLASAACETEVEGAADESQMELSADPASGVAVPSVSTVHAFHAGVGAPIDARTGIRWIENDRRVASGEVISYTIRAATLQRILELPGCVGISLQYGVDDLGEILLLPIGVNGDGLAIGDSVPAGAKRFTRRYTGTVKGHFFGSDTFTRLLDERRSEVVRATPALDDDHVPQILLSDAAEKEPRVYEDRSYPCASACPSLPEV